MGPLDPLPPPSLPGPPPPPPPPAPLPPVPPAPAPVPEFPASPPPSGGGSKLPWIITAAVAIVAAVVVVVVLAARGGDSTSSGVASTSPSSAVPTAPPTTASPATVPPSSAVASTAPPTSASSSPPTTPPTTDAGVVVVADDTKTFSVLMLARFETDTAPLVDDKGSFARVTGSDDLAAFEQHDDHDTFGISVLVAESESVQNSADLMARFDPGADVCADRSTQSDYETTNGLAQVLLLDGCGTGGESAKVVMAIDVPAEHSVILLVAQGQGPSNTDLFDFAQAVGESVVIL